MSPETKNVFRSDSGLSFTFATSEILQKCTFDLVTARLRAAKNLVPSPGYLSTENSTVGKLGKERNTFGSQISNSLSQKLLLKLQFSEGWFCLR